MRRGGRRDPQLVGDQVGVGGDPVGALDHEPAQRLAQAQLDAGRAWRPRSTTRRTAAMSSSSSSSSAARRLRPAGEEDRVGAPGHTSTTSACHRCSVRKGMTGAMTRRLAPARPTACAARPRRRPRTGVATGGCTSWTGRRRSLERPQHLDREVALVAVGGLGHQPPRAVHEPAVERVASSPSSAASVEVGQVGGEAGDVGVLDEERHAVPQREQLAPDLLARPEAEQQVLVGRLLAVLPAHDVGAHAGEGVVGVDHVAPRAVHLAAVLGEHLLVAQHLAVREPAR